MVISPKAYVVATPHVVYSEFSSSAACICGVFSDKEAAEEFAKARHDAKVYEFTVDEPPVFGEFL